MSIYDVLRLKAFRWLYLSQAINLFGDAMSWTGLAILSYNIAGDKAPVVLSSALTIRVLIYVFVSPFGGVLADKIDRKALMLGAHIFRMILVALLTFANSEWQIYVFVACFNFFSAFYTPTFKATIPFVVKDKKLFSRAISLSSATYQLLGVLGPGIAGGIIALFSLKYVFWLDASTFLLSSICILLIPMKLKIKNAETMGAKEMVRDIFSGTKNLFNKSSLRIALFMQLVISIIGAEILVNTIFHVKEKLHLSDTEYGYVMSALAIGTVVGAIIVGRIKAQNKKVMFTVFGALMACVLMFFANSYVFGLTLVAWMIMGLFESFVNVPTDMLIADLTPQDQQGKVYGAHFAWSHLWWVLGYPIAGLSATYFAQHFFMVGSTVGAVLLILTVTSMLLLRRINPIKKASTEETI